MHLYVYYLKQTYPEAFIKTLLSKLLGYAEASIGELNFPGEYTLRYENRYLDPAEFNTELSIFCWENDFESRTGGKIQFGSQISQYIRDEVVVKYLEDDPHQWVLISNDRFFVVPENVGDNIGINLRRDQQQELNA